ncbi:MAG: cold-shock protein [Alphaproteobacteria bacterium]|nr:cold-shock protein [Alphaproteobacteria bacterium]
MIADSSFDAGDPPRRDVRAVVKWYNPAKGFGFVQPDDGSADAFLHISVVAAAGHSELAEGAEIVCDISEGRKGPQVAAIHAVQPSEGRPAPKPGGGAMTVEGTVKFFNGDKGFGFVTPDDGGKDVFIAARMIERFGLRTLAQGQRVRVTTRMGQKGPMAEAIELLQ